MTILRVALMGTLLGVVPMLVAACSVDAGGGTVVLGGACAADTDCEVGDACDDTGVCVTDVYVAGSEAVGDPCFEDADCGDGTCDNATDTCI